MFMCSNIIYILNYKIIYILIIWIFNMGNITTSQKKNMETSDKFNTMEHIENIEEDELGLVNLS